MRYIIFAGILVCALLMTSVTPYFKKAATANQATAVTGLSDLQNNIGTLKEGSSGVVQPLVDFDKAFDIREGDSVVFESLTVGFNKIDEPIECGQPGCRKISLTLSSLEAESDVIIAEGETVEWGGYIIRLSQVAPLENIGGVPYRIVLLVGSGK